MEGATRLVNSVPVDLEGKARVWMQDEKKRYKMLPNHRAREWESGANRSFANYGFKKFQSKRVWTCQGRESKLLQWATHPGGLNFGGKARLEQPAIVQNFRQRRVLQSASWVRFVEICEAELSAKNFWKDESRNDAVF